MLEGRWLWLFALIVGLVFVWLCWLFIRAIGDMFAWS